MEIARVFEFDSAHRLMRHKGKCCNIHGHRYKVELFFSYFEVDEDGFSIDFSKIKRLAGNWIDDFLDHAILLNPEDDKIIELCRNNLWKVYKMGLFTNKDTNPTIENIASELFYVFSILFNYAKNNVSISKVVLYETPTQFVEIANHSYVGTPSHRESILSWEKNLDNIKITCI